MEKLLELNDEKLASEEIVKSDEELSCELFSDREILLDPIDKPFAEDDILLNESEELLILTVMLESVEEVLGDKLLDRVFVPLACDDCCWLDEDGGSGFSPVLLIDITEDVMRTNALGVLLLPPPQAVKNTDMVKTQAIPRK